MNKRLWLFFCGYLIIKIKGITPPRLLTILFQEGIEVWEVRDEEDSFTFHIALNDLLHLQEIGRSINCPPLILKEVGLPFYLSSIRERSFFFVGIVVVILLLYALSSFIWFVELEGIETLNEEDIYHLLGQLGLLPGAYRGQIDIREIERNLQIEEPRIAWVNIELVGSMARVHLFEKTVFEEKNSQHLYSSKDAVITKLILLKGQALVEEGDVVLKGDLLIEGDEGGEALALIEGRTWYEAYGYASLREPIEIETGHYATSCSLRFLQGPPLHLLGAKEAPYKEYQLETDSYLFYLGRNPYLPIELIKKEYRKLHIFHSLKAPSIAKTLAQEEALRKILQDLDEQGTILETKTTLFEEEEGIGAHVVLEVIESIVAKGADP